MVVLLLAFALIFAGTTSANAQQMPSFEMHSQNLVPLHRWVSVLARWQDQKSLTRPCGSTEAHADCVPSEWTALNERLRGRSPRAVVDAVQMEFNRRPYVAAPSDAPWETPYEFLLRNGQCQDYAIAKYMLLRTLGFAAERLRIVIVRDGRQNLDHAVLLVDVDGEVLLLDNLERAVVPARRAVWYKPYYSFDETGWWSHFRAQRLSS